MESFRFSLLIYAAHQIAASDLTCSRSNLRCHPLPEANKVYARAMLTCQGCGMGPPGRKDDIELEIKDIENER